jgi:hypothetical protein
VLAATRHFGTGGGGRITNVYLIGTHGRVEAIHGDAQALSPRLPTKSCLNGTGNSDGGEAVR